MNGAHVKEVSNLFKMKHKTNVNDNVEFDQVALAA